MHEDLNMLRTIAEQEAIDKAARHSARIDAIGREGHRHQLQLTRPKKGYSACYLGEKPPSAMTRPLSDNGTVVVVKEPR
jgi:hypothetical protein